jgi:DNA polymerase II small subunit/DNA polymerase delta subunit B
MEKQEIVKLFLENELQLTPNALEIIFQKQDIIDKIISFAKENKLLVIDESVLEKILTPKTEISQLEIKIVYPEELEEFTTEDVLRVMKERFEILSRIIQENQRLQNLTSLSKIKKLKKGEEATVIGMIKDKTIYTILLEDFTSHETIQMEAKVVEKLFYDDVIGVKVRKEEEKLIGDKIFFPSLSFFRKTGQLNKDVIVSNLEIKIDGKSIPLEKKEIVKTYIEDFKLLMIDNGVVEKYRQKDEKPIDTLVSLIERRHLNPSFFISKKVYKKDLFLLDEVPDAIAVLNSNEFIYKAYKGINLFLLPVGKKLNLRKKSIE